MLRALENGNCVRISSINPPDFEVLGEGMVMVEPKEPRRTYQFANVEGVFEIKRN